MAKEAVIQFGDSGAVIEGVAANPNPMGNTGIGYRTDGVGARLCSRSRPTSKGRTIPTAYGSTGTIPTWSPATVGSTGIGILSSGSCTFTRSRLTNDPEDDEGS